MDKISFHYELSEEQKVKKKQLVEKLLAHPYIKEWLKKQQLDEHFVEEHSLHRQLHQLHLGGCGRSAGA